MKAIHFGAGNIGRGFIGKVLNDNDYEVTFVDVNETIINQINEEKAYQVVIANEENTKEPVSDVKGINSITETDKLKSDFRSRCHYDSCWCKHLTYYR